MCAQLHTVWKNVRGVDLNLDYHRRGSYGNLASNISCGACTRPWASGGSSNRGPHAGAFNTVSPQKGTGGGIAACLPPLLTCFPPAPSLPLSLSLIFRVRTLLPILLQFWNWYHSSGTGSWNLPTDTYGPYLNFIGYGKNTAALTSPYFWHKETVASGYTLVPAELHASMLAKRLASPGGIATAAAAAASRR